MPLIPKFARLVPMDVSVTPPRAYPQSKYSQERPLTNAIIVIGGAVVGQKSGKNRGTADMRNSLIVSASANAVAANVSVRNM